MKTNTNSSPHIPPNSSINLKDYAMDIFFHTHNHSEKTCPKFINSFRVMLLPPEEDKNKEEEQEGEAEEEEEEEGPELHLNIIWDEENVDNDDDDVMEEACVRNAYNLRNKGAPKPSDSTPTLKMATNKTPSTTRYATKATSIGKYS